MYIYILYALQDVPIICTPSSHHDELCYSLSGIPAVPVASLSARLSASCGILRQTYARYAPRNQDNYPLTIH